MSQSRIVIGSAIIALSAFAGLVEGGGVPEASMDNVIEELSQAKREDLRTYGSVWLIKPVQVAGKSFQLVVDIECDDRVMLADAALHAQQQLMSGRPVPHVAAQYHTLLVRKIWHSRGVWIDGLGNQKGRLLTGLSADHHRTLLTELTEAYGLDLDIVYELVNTTNSCSWVLPLLSGLDDEPWRLQPGIWAVQANCGDQVARQRLVEIAIQGGILEQTLSKGDALSWRMIEELVDKRIMEGEPTKL